MAKITKQTNNAVGLFYNGFSYADRNKNKPIVNYWSIIASKKSSDLIIFK